MLTQAHAFKVKVASNLKKAKKQSETERRRQSRDLAAADKMQEGIIDGGPFAAAAEQPALSLKKR